MGDNKGAPAELNWTDNKSWVRSMGSMEEDEEDEDEKRKGNGDDGGSEDGNDDGTPDNDVFSFCVRKKCISTKWSLYKLLIIL